MALFDRDLGIVAAAAVALSPKARELVREGAVYGVAGALKAGDVVVSTARGAVRGAQEGLSGAADHPGGTVAAEPDSSPSPRQRAAGRRSAGGTGKASPAGEA